MRRLIHVSDLHFGTELPALVEGLLRSSVEFSPHLAVVSGDLTQRARSAQFASARQFLCQLPCPALVVPGNHDLAPLYSPLERLVAPLARYRRALRDVSCERWLDDEVAVVGLSSVQPLRVKEGSIAPRQVLALREGLERTPAALRMIAVHHPVLPRQGPRSAALVAALAASDVAVCLSGHLHVSSHGASPVREGLPEAELPGMLLLQAATATSQRLRGEPNGYYRLTVDGPRLHIEVMAWSGARFERSAVASYLRQDGIWRSVPA
jgi:3',5'-cyclic AMP phosphodiesterase CpdA